MEGCCEWMLSVCLFGDTRANFIRVVFRWLSTLCFFNVCFCVSWKMLVKANNLCFGFVLYLTSQQGFHLVKFQSYCLGEMMLSTWYKHLLSFFSDDMCITLLYFTAISVVIKIFQNELWNKQKAMSIKCLTCK